MAHAPRPRRRAARRVLTALFVFALGVAVGGLATIATLPTMLPRANRVEREAGADPGARGGSTAMLQAIAAFASPSTAEPRPPVEQLAQRLLRSPTDPGHAVSQMIDGMSDAERLTAITSFTNLRSEDLDDVRDVRSYARRLAAIAMDGVLLDRQPPAGTTPAVLFADQVDELGFPTDVGQSFGTGEQSRIYALFPSEDYANDQVLVKWFREGDPELLLFARYPIEPGAPLSHVWMQREAGWEEGPYVVEFYDPSEPLERIAAGRYVVDASAAAASAAAPLAP